MKPLKIFFLFFVISMHSQNMIVETTFGDNGMVFFNGNYPSSYPKNIHFTDNNYYIVSNNNTIYSITNDGNLNTSFAPNGYKNFNATGEELEFRGSKLENGYLYIFGKSTISNIQNGFILKLALDGNPDPTFGSNGKLIVDLGNYEYESINEILIDTSGSIWATGKYDSLFLLKITLSGTLDTTYNSLGYKFFPNENVSFVEGQNIFVYGNDFLLTGSSNAKNLLLFMFDNTGQPLTNFGTDGIKQIFLAESITDTVLYSVIESSLHPNGKIYFSYSYAASFISNYKKLGSYNLAANGNSYDELSNLPFSIPTFKILSDEKYYTFGAERCSPPTSSNCASNFKLTKKNPNGTLDLSFTPSGYFEHNFFPNDLLSEDIATAFYTHEDGKILLAGNLYNPFSTNGIGKVFIRIEPSTFLANQNLKRNTFFEIYPNPSSNFIYINNIENKDITTIEVTDILGKGIASYKGNITEIDIQQLQTGIYFLKIFINEGLSIHKFIKK